MDKYEYVTGNNLRYKVGVVEKVKSEYSSLGEALNNKAKSKIGKRDKMVKTNKQDKNVIYNSQHSFVKLKDTNVFEVISQTFCKKLDELKNVSPQVNKNEDLKKDVLENVLDTFNEFYYIYNERYEEKQLLLKKKT